MKIEKEQVYIRDGENCSLCNKLICFKNAYYWNFTSGYILVCSKCNKNKEIVVLNTSHENEDCGDDYDENDE